MNNNYDLELCIFSCLLQKPELMENIEIDDKYFVKYQKMWLFMKAFYLKFKTFDIPLMANASKNSYHLINYIEEIIKIEPVVSNFDLYLQQLKDNYNEEKKEKWLIDNIFSLANHLYNRNINTSDFKKEVDYFFEKAEKIYESD